MLDSRKCVSQPCGTGYFKLKDISYQGNVFY